MEALILEIGTRGLHRYAPIEGEVTTIGRALDNDIILSDPTVAAHHLKIIRSEDSLELVNLTEVNPTQVNPKDLEQLLEQGKPLSLQLGRTRVQIHRRDSEVAKTRPLAGNSRSSRLFGSSISTTLLVMTCLIVGALEFYLSAYTSFNWSDLFKYVLRETVLSLGAFLIALSVLERLLVNRWEVRQLLTSICLVYLLYYLLNIISNGMVYLVSANWPSTVILLIWFLCILPGAITLYLINISHLKRKQSLLFALMIASPIALPALLQNGELKALLDDFSSVARYQNSLSAGNWHLSSTISIEEFINNSGKLDQGEFAD
jgi:hypothetical protein